MSADVSLTDYGFEWGNLTVSRYASLPNGVRVLGIEIDGKRVMQVYVSRTGRSVRAYRVGQGEMTVGRERA